MDEMITCVLVLAVLFIVLTPVCLYGMLASVHDDEYEDDEEELDWYLYGAPLEKFIVEDDCLSWQESDADTVCEFVADEALGEGALGTVIESVHGELLTTRGVMTACSDRMYIISLGHGDTGTGGLVGDLVFVGEERTNKI